MDRDNLRVLRFLRHGPLGLGELAEKTSLARNTVATRVDHLIRRGLIKQGPSIPAERGRPSVRFKLNERAALLYLVFFDETHVTGAICDLGGTELGSLSRCLDEAYETDDAIRHIVEIRDTICAENGIDRADLQVCVLGVQGPVAEDQKTVPWSRVGLLPTGMAAVIGMPVIVENDANLMAVGVAASQDGAEPIMCILVSNGIGAGIVTNGAVHRGTGGWAGEIGHVPILAAGERPCVCGSRGCSSAVAGNLALYDMLRAKGHSVATISDVAQLAVAGNLDAILALRNVGRNIGEAILGLVIAIAPGRIIVAGHAAEIGDHLLAGVRETIVYRMPAALAARIQVEISAEYENTMRRGALSLGFDSLFPPKL